MNLLEPAPAHVGQNNADPQAPAITPPALALGIFNTLVPGLFVLFAWAHAAAFVQTLRFSNVIILASTGLSLHFHVRKHTIEFVSTSAYAWSIALAGTCSPLLFRPTTDLSDFAVGTWMQLTGAAMLIYLIRTHGRTSATSLARRGIARDGLYRFVRHPLYLAFILVQYGYVLNHTSFWNLLFCSLAIFLQVLRINEEERLLLGDEPFKDYVEQTPWRIVPGVF